MYIPSPPLCIALAPVPRPPPPPPLVRIMACPQQTIIFPSLAMPNCLCSKIQAGDYSAITLAEASLLQQV
uniref:Uncharacterized protein n=1 Tax=Bionectria ochroleuca TaxID=29856 RepID=A0A0B7KB25_BIOOC